MLKLVTKGWPQNINLAPYTSNRAYRFLVVGSTICFRDKRVRRLYLAFVIHRPTNSRAIVIFRRSKGNWQVHSELALIETVHNHNGHEPFPLIAPLKTKGALKLYLTFFNFDETLADIVFPQTESKVG